MIKQNAAPEDLEDITITPQELHILSELDSRQYGFLLLNQPENAKKNALVQKALKYLQLMVIQARQQQKLRNENEPNNYQAKSISIDPKTWVKLGHFHLLLEEYRKALSAYQMFFKTQERNHWQNTTFLYGLGLVYFHFNAFQWAIKLFRELLYVSPDFQQACEVNLRLGIMFKATQEYELAHKHLQLALMDNSPCTAPKNVIKFHIAHLYEIQGKVKIAKDKYESLLKDKTLAQSLKAEIFRQLGWLYHCQDALGDKSQRVPLAIHCLQKANEADQFSGQTLYLLGRCYASIGKVHDAFIAYRKSVEKSEGNADTWCSIGVLYQQQNQPMDALQAYVCAVQLDKYHSAAWANLGILYENSLQARDAYACYINSNHGLSNSESIDETTASLRLSKLSLSNVGMNPQLTQRINFLQNHLSNAPMPSFTSQRRQLLSIEEAWNLPISAEMSSRQQQSSQTNRNGSSQSLQKGYSGSNTQGPPPPYPDDANRPIKPDPDKKTVQVQPSYGLTPQQTQLLNYFQQNANILTPNQLSVMQQLQHQLRLHQNQQIRNSQKAANEALNTADNQTNSDKLIQPNIGVAPRNLGLSKDLEDNLEEDLKNLISQKDLATTITENFLRTFGSEDIDTKDMPATNSLIVNNNRNKLPDDLKQEMPPEKKRKMQGQDSILTIKNEPSWDFDSVSSMVKNNKSKIEYSIEMDAQTVLSFCKTEALNGDINEALIASSCAPPAAPDPPPMKLSHQQLLPPTPSVYLDNKKHALSLQLQEFCLKHHIAVIRGLAAALKLDLGLFSTNTLVEANPEHPIEVRTQLHQPSDKNWDPQTGKNVWACISQKSHSTIAKYAQYQASSFKESLREEREKSHSGLSDSDSKDSTQVGGKRRKLNANTFQTTNLKILKEQKSLKFATNIDLSDDRKWRPQLQELMKLPAFARVVSAANMLSHVGHPIVGMNTVRLYMKVPGSRTLAHQESNNFCAVNINIGPGDCEWFAVPDGYWGAVHAFCEKYQINYLNGCWWPVLDELYQANIPVYRFLQRPGDLVWVNAGCIHWVQAVGWCNNIAWNVGSLNARQYQLALERYDWNRLHGVKSAVPMLHLSWNLSRNLNVTEKSFFESIRKVLLRTMIKCYRILEYIKNKGVEIKFHGRSKNETSHYCGLCETEVFNILFIREQEKRHVVHCLHCASKQSPNLEGFVCLEEYRMQQLCDVYNNFILYPNTQATQEQFRLV